MQPFVGFAPDVDPTTQGVITDCSNIIPTVKGYKSAPSQTDVNVSVLPSEPTRMKQVYLLGGAAPVVACTSNNIYVLNNGFSSIPPSWTSKLSVTGVSSSPGWCIDSFGDAVLVTGKSAGLIAGVSGTYSAVSGGPDADYIACASGFVMAASIGTEYDRWKCAAYNTYDDWTLSAANQCVTGRLVDSGSRIYGLKALGDRFVIYKDAGIYVGEYVGTPEVWRWNLVQSNIGIYSNQAVIDVGNAHVFIGRDDFYYFDGIRPIPLECPLREWFFGLSNVSYTQIQGAYDSENKNIYWFFSNGSSDYAIIFNLTTKKWGYISGTFNSPAVITFTDEANRGISGIASFNSSHELMPHNGTNATSSITTGNIGDDTQFSTIRRVTPRFIDAPTSATMTLYEDNTYGDSFTSVGSAVSLDSNGRFDVLNSARWHKMKFDFTGDMEIVGARYDLIPDGTE